MNSNSNNNTNRRKSIDPDLDNAVLTAAVNRMTAIQSTSDAAAAHKHHRSRDNIDYNKDLEVLLKDNAEECESLGILHRASYEKYSRLSNYINIPVIILSSAIGFATGIDIGYSNMNIILGVGSIFVGIIKSIDTYFQLGKRSESHRLCSLQYQQIHKKIQIELALQREQRQTAKDMLSVIKTDIKNLQDISPLIDQDIINNYNDKYGNYTTVKKPNFVNGLTEVAINDTDEHGKDVLHSRPRSAPISAGESLSGSDDDGDSGGGGSGTSRSKFAPDKLNKLIQIHAFTGGSANNNQHANSANVSDMITTNVNANSLNFRDVTSSGLSQQSNNSRRSHISSLHSQHTPNMAGEDIRLPPTIISASLTTLSAPSLLNTFSNIQPLHNSQLQGQTPISRDRNEIVDSGGGDGGNSDNANVIINVDHNNFYPRMNDDDNGAM